jgi:hypothetical protein
MLMRRAAIGATAAGTMPSALRIAIRASTSVNAMRPAEAKAISMKAKDATM